jgi:hypothetical protein
LLGGVASGKSIAARQLALQMRASGKDVYLVISSDHRFLREDLAYLVKSAPDFVIIFDGAIRYHEDILWFLSNRTNKQGIVCVENNLRWIGDERIQKFNDEQLFRDLKILNLEELDEKELASFVELFESTGMWGEVANLSKEAKLRKLSVEYESKVRSVLLSFVRSKYVRDIVLKDITSACISPDHKRLLATTFILSSLDVRPTETELEGLSGLSTKAISTVLKEKRIGWLLSSTNAGIVSKSLCVGHFLA